MSVIVKGMEMPKSCKGCFINPSCCPAFSAYLRREITGEKPDINRLTGCPLVELPEKHGRLIDADANIAVLKKCYDKPEK